MFTESHPEVQGAARALALPPGTIVGLLEKLASFVLSILIQTASQPARPVPLAAPPKV